MKAPTEKQLKIIEFITNQQLHAGYSPSTYEIAEHFGIAQNAVMNHLRALEKKGILQKQHDKRRRARAYSFIHQLHQLLPPPPNSHKTVGGFSLPLFAQIPAGTPQTVADSQEGFVEICQEWFGKGELVAVKVKGNSMIGDHINSGDMAIIKLQKEAVPKDILAVRIADGEVTLKRIKKRQDKIDLIPSNPDYPIRTVDASDVEIIGKLISIIRKY